VEPKLQELKARLLEITDLENAAAVLDWDQQTYMPPGGAEARARQLALLRRLGHEKFIDPAIGKLLDDLRPYEQSLPHDSDDASLVRVTRRNYEKAARIPPAFSAKLAQHAAETYQLWTKARPANDFASVRPRLERTVDLNRELANFFPGYEHIADPLIDFCDYGMKASDVRAIFGQLRGQLLPLVNAITSQPPADDSCLRQKLPLEPQLAFGVEVIKRFGYDFKRGRQDLTHHPFMTKFSLGDVRITTRGKDDYLVDCVFSTLHEAGHALYEQGICPAYEGTPLANGASTSVHESQSRTWENIVGRSRGFWKFFYPKLQSLFPGQLKGVSLDTFYRAINKVERSLIRTDADEVTYNLHVMLRFELELQLLEGKLTVRDLPDVWHERYKTDIGVRAPDDRDGVLQDVHWYGGIFGYFQGYTLGNIMSAQFFETALRAHPQIPQEIEKGEFGTIHGWLKQHIYQHGAKFTADELLHRVTGNSLTVEPYIGYLRKKFAELYRL
jgi:carboxypeptidase Taq